MSSRSIHPHVVESLESRYFFSTSSGNFLAPPEAEAPAAVAAAAEADEVVRVSFDDHASKAFVDAIDDDDDPVDIYQFKLKQRSSFDARLRGLQENADLEIVDANGRQLWFSAHRTLRDERIAVTLEKGTYQVRVFQGKANAETPYNLRLTADLNWGKIEKDGERNDIGIRFLTQDARPIRGDRFTYVLIHDWNDTPADLARLGNSVNLYYVGDQVLVLDWSDAARADSLDDAKQWVSRAGKFLAERLEHYGLFTEAVTLIGHGLGAYVAAETAERFDLGVRALVALDPSKGASNYNFRQHSQIAMSLVGSNLGSQENAHTADSSFRVYLDGDGDEDQKHVGVVDLYASMLRQTAFRSGDKVSRMLDLRELHIDGRRPWEINAFDGFEGKIHGSELLQHWRADRFVYRFNGVERTIIA